jgi:DNA replication and repair protein RecF
LESGDLLHLLLNHLREDLGSQRTGYGVHRDELIFTLDGYMLRDTGSQGQIKSFLIALKLAQYRMILNATGKKPVVLLDDIFEKLDKQRLHVLFDILTTDDFEQVFITDADEMRSRGFFQEAGIDCDHLVTEAGTIA